MTVLLFLLLVGGLIALAVGRSSSRGLAGAGGLFDDAEVEACRWYDRLGGGLRRRRAVRW